MAPSTRSEESDPVLEVSASGTANADGAYLQHDAVSPHKARSAEVDPKTVVIRHESLPPVGQEAGACRSGLPDEPCAGVDIPPMPEETTAITRAGLRGKSRSLFRLLAFVENHRITTLMFVVGAMLLLVAALLATR